jgi:hypothetical protein
MAQKIVSLQEITQRAEALITVLEKLGTSISKTSGKAESFFQGADPKDVDSIKNMNEQLEKSIKSVRNLESVEKDKIKIQKQLADLESKRLRIEKQKLDIEAKRQINLDREIRAQQKAAKQAKINTNVKRDEVDATEKSAKQIEEEAKQREKHTKFVEEENKQIKAAIELKSGREKALENVNKQRKEEEEIDKRAILNKEKLNAERRAELDDIKRVAERQRILNQEFDLSSATARQIGERIKALRGDYEDLNAELRENEEVGGAIEEELKQLGEAQREIKENVGETTFEFGGFRDALGDAAQETAELTGQSKIYGALQKIITFGQDTYNKSVVIGEKVLGKLGIAVNTTGKRFKVLNTIIKGSALFLLVAALTPIIALFAGTQAGADKLTAAIDKLKASFSFLVGIFAQIASGEIGLLEAFNKFKDGIGDVLEETEKLTEANIKLRDSTIALTKTIALEEAQLEQLNQVANDTTISFAKQEAANREAARVGISLREKELELAELNLKAVNRDFNQQKRLGTLTAELEQRQADAVANLLKAQSALRIEIEETNIRERQISQDRAKRDIDQLRQGFENRREINDRVLKDEQKLFADRREFLNANKKLADESFAAQIRVIQTQTRRQVDANRLLTLNNEQLNKEIRSLGLASNIEGELITLIKERQRVNADLALQDQELTQAQIDNRQKLLDLFNNSELNIAQREEDINKEIELEEELFETRVEALRKEFGENAEFKLLLENLEKEHEAKIDDIKLKALEERQQEELVRLETQLLKEGQSAQEIAEAITDKKIEQLGIEVDARKEANLEVFDQELELQKLLQAQRKQDLEEVLEVADVVLDAAKQGLQRRSEEEQRLNEETIQKQTDRVKQQEERAAQGLSNTLAREQRLLEQAEAEKIRLANKEQQRQEALLFIDLLRANLDKDPNTAFARASADFALTKASLAAIQGFKDGVEDLQGAGTGTSDSNLHWLSKGESVATAKATKKNRGLVTAMNNDTVQDWVALNMSPNIFKENKEVDNSQMIMAVKSLEKTVKKSKASTTVNVFGSAEVNRSGYYGTRKTNIGNRLF